MAKIKSSDNNTKKEVIINEAAILFKEKGYKAASMRELAAKVGVEAASLYNHIKSKDELLNEICFEVARRYQSFMSDLEKEKLTIAKKVEKIIRFHVKAMQESYEFVYVTDQNWRQLNEPGLSNYRELRRNYRRRFASIVQQGIDTHELKPLDANSMVMVIINAIAAVDQWHRIIHKVDSKQLEDTIVSVLVNGINV